MTSNTYYYELLEITQDADSTTIKSAFRKMAMKYHPDRNPDNPEAEAKFKQINEAYTVLSDPQKRASYDRYGPDGVNGGGMGGGGFSGDPSDIFGDVFGDMFGDIFGGGNRSRRQGPQRGADLRYDYEISLEEAFKGVEAEITIPNEETCDACDGSGSEPPHNPETCPTCGGTGQVRVQNGFFMMTRTCSHCGGRGTIIAHPCKKCKGKGAFEVERKLSVTIPAGVEDGQRIRLGGEGARGTRGGPKGDLYIFLSVKKHQIFDRDGRDLYIHMPIPMTKAALGGKIEVPIIDGGKAEIDIPDGAQTGRKIKIRAHGMTQLKSALRGDMYVELFVETPRKLTAKQKQLLAEFDAECGASSHPETKGFFDKAKKFWDKVKK